MEAQRAVWLAHEDAVKYERVKVEVNVHRPAEALHARHHAGLPTREPLAPRLAAIHAAERAHEDVQHRAAEPVIVGQPVAQSVRDREYPLPDRHVGRQHVVDEVRRALGHAPSPAARTNRPPFAREGHEPLERAVPAPHAGEAVRQHPTPEELPELGGDERWQATPISPGIDGGEEVGEVRAHNTVEHARCR